MIGVSQSGGSPDLVRSLEVARDCGALTVAVTNNAASDLARAADRARRRARRTGARGRRDQVLHRPAARAAPAARPGRRRHAAPRPPGCPTSATPCWNAAGRSPRSRQRYRFAQRMVTTGRGYSYPTAREAALKLMETAYLSAQAFSAADLLHGPLAMIDPQVPVLAVVADGIGGRAMAPVLPRLAERGADVLRRRRRRRGRRTWVCAAVGRARGAVAAAGDPAVPAARAARRRRSAGATRTRRAGWPRSRRRCVILVRRRRSSPPVSTGRAGCRPTATGSRRSGRARARRPTSTTPVLVPGFVDVHVHGGAGAAFPGGDAEEALRAVAFHRAHGTTTTLASLVAAAPEELRRVGGRARRARRRRGDRGRAPGGPLARRRPLRRPRPRAAARPRPGRAGRAAGHGRDRDGHPGPGARRRARRHPPGRRGGRGGRGRAHRRRLRADPRGDRRGRPARHAPVQRHGPAAPPRARARPWRCSTTTA